MRLKLSEDQYQLIVELCHVQFGNEDMGAVTEFLGVASNVVYGTYDKDRAGEEVLELIDEIFNMQRVLNTTLNALLEEHLIPIISKSQEAPIRSTKE